MAGSGLKQTGSKKSSPHVRRKRRRRRDEILGKPFNAFSDTGQDGVEVRTGPGRNMICEPDRRFHDFPLWLPHATPAHRIR